MALPAALSFQKDHGLTVDGIIGRATLSTLQRRLDERAKGMVPVTILGPDAFAQLYEVVP